MVSKKFATDLTIIFFATLSLIILLNTAEYFLLLVQTPYVLLSVLLVPIVEEFYKYVFAKKMPERAFIAIIVFAIFEIVVVKIPLMYINYNGESTLSFLLPIASFIFHVSTAFNYTDSSFIIRPRFVLFAMIILHCLFNLLSYMNVSIATLLVSTMLVSLAPYIWLILSRKLFN